MNPAQAPRQGRATLVTLLLGALFLACASAIGLHPDVLLALPPQLAELAGFFYPVDWHYAGSRALPALLESLQIAWIGTLIGALLSLPLALLGARTLFPVASRGVALISAISRAFPEILLAIYFVPIVGMGAFAGALAIGVGSIGMLTKLGSEVVEALDPRPAEAVAAAGGSRLMVLRFAVLPQVLPELAALWLFRFELNLRASAVLGVVGAGGIGGVLLNALRYRHFEKAAAVLVVTVLAVLLIDALSSRLRQRLLR